MMSRIDLSIVIVNFRTKEYTKICLNSILENPSSVNYELIVVDNNSSDGSVEMLERDFPGARLIANAENVGFAQANNQAVRISKGRYIVLLNPDTKVLPKAMDILYSFMETHPDAGIAAPKLLNDDLSLQRSCRDFPGLWPDISKALGLMRYLPNHSVFGYIRIKGWDHDKIRKVDQPQGACLIVRRDALQEDDLFDRRFYMYYEEVDLCYRMKKRNWQIYYVPEAKVIHFAGKSYSKNMPRMIFHKYKSRFLFYKKHYDLLRQSVLYLLTVFETIYRISIYSFVGLIKTSRREEIVFRIRGYFDVLSNFARGRLPNR